MMAVDFGTCWSCVSGLTFPARMVTGFRVVAEAIARRWNTEHGTLIDDPDYGYDLGAFVNADLTPTQLANIARGAAAEAEKDERVQSCKCVVTFNSNDGSLLVAGAVTTANGPFDLVISVSNLTVTLLQPAA